jgi:hypothetical protein
MKKYKYEYQKFINYDIYIQFIFNFEINFDKNFEGLRKKLTNGKKKYTWYCQNIIYSPQNVEENYPFEENYFFSCLAGKYFNSLSKNFYNIKIFQNLIAKKCKKKINLGYQNFYKCCICKKIICSTCLDFTKKFLNNFIETNYKKNEFNLKKKIECHYCFFNLQQFRDYLSTININKKRTYYELFNE